MKYLLILFTAFSLVADANTDTSYFSQQSRELNFRYKNILQVYVLRNCFDSLNLTLQIRNVSKNIIGIPYMLDEFEHGDNEGVVCFGCSGYIHGETYGYRTYALYPNECDTIIVTYKKMKNYRVSILFCPDINKLIKSISNTAIVKDSINKIAYFKCFTNELPFLPQSRIYIENLGGRDVKSMVKVFGWDFQPVVPDAPVRKKRKPK